MEREGAIAFSVGTLEDYYTEEAMAVIRTKEDFYQPEVKILSETIRHDREVQTYGEKELENYIQGCYERRLRFLEQRVYEQNQLARRIYAFYSGMTLGQKKNFFQAVFEAIRGLGLLGRIIMDKSITEVMINGPKDIFIEREGKLERYPETFEDQESLMQTIMNFTEKTDRQATESNPIVDTRLPDKSRVNVVMPPVALNGPIVTIRRFPEKPWTIQDMIEKKHSLTWEAARFLEKLVIAGYNIFISGGTGSGKTTFLNALSNFIPSNERVITIEDSAELQIVNIPNLVRLETRPSNDPNLNITIRDLIKSALRMRPDRIVVGEVRGAEALDMLQAMNTGHDGSLSTGHANSANDMLSRLETMVLSGSGEALPLKAIRQQIFSAVDIIVHLARQRDYTRKVMTISELYRMEGDKIELRDIFRFEEDEKTTPTRVSGRLVRRESELARMEKLERKGIRNIWE